MSAMSDALITICEGMEADGLGEFDELMSRMLDTVPTGYRCKRCGGPAPVGVGYVYGTIGGYTAKQLAVVSCPCGYSQAAHTHTGFECGAL